MAVRNFFVTFGQLKHNDNHGNNNYRRKRNLNRRF